MKSETTISQALRKSGGNITLAAKMLGIQRCSLYERISKSDNLRRVLDDERETLIDIAERNVRKAVLEGSIDDSWKILRTVGKHRGFTEKQEIDVSATAVVFGDGYEEL